MLDSLSVALESLRRAFADRSVQVPAERPPPPAQSSADCGVSVLRSAGVIVDLPAADELRLEPSFRRDWHRRVDAVRRSGTARDRFAKRLEVDQATLEIGTIGRRYAATCDDDLVGVWPSRAAFLADLTAAPLLEERISDWDALTADQHETALTTVRTLLESCPNCDGAIVESAPSTGSETAAATRTVVYCGRCGSELARTPADGPGRGDGGPPLSARDADPYSRS